MPSIFVKVQTHIAAPATGKSVIFHGIHAWQSFRLLWIWSAGCFFNAGERALPFTHVHHF